MIKSKKPPKPLKRTPLKRTPIKRKPIPNRKLETDSDSGEPKILKYTLPTKSADPKPLKYAKPAKEPKEKKKPKAINKIGKRTRKRIDTNAILKERFLRWGITHCELGYVGCWREVQGFAHSKKSRNLITEEDWQEVIAACNSCHDQIEILGNKGMVTMYDVVTKKIKERMAELSKWVKI